MKLILQTLTGTKYDLEVDPQDKVRKIKVQIFSDLNIKNKVRLLWQNKPIEDEVTLSAQGITEDAILQIVFESDTKIMLKIRTFKKGMISLEISDSHTVFDLLEELESSALLPSAQATDFYFRGVSLSEEKLPFHFYGILDGAVISQIYQGSFHLKIDDARDFAFLKYITVRGTDTIKALKEKVLDTINETRGAGEMQLVEDDIVIFQTKETCKKDGSLGISYVELDRETCTISDCNLRPLDIIPFIRYHGEARDTADIKIDEYEPTKKSHRIYDLYNLETVFSLRLKIQHQLQIPFERQGLFIAGMSNPPSINKKVSKDRFDVITMKVKA